MRRQAGKKYVVDLVFTKEIHADLFLQGFLKQSIRLFFKQVVLEC